MHIPGQDSDATGIAKELLTYLHKLTHLGNKKMINLLKTEEMGSCIPRRDSLIQQIIDDCEAYAKVNASRPKLPIGVQARGHTPNPLGNVFY